MPIAQPANCFDYNVGILFCQIDAKEPENQELKNRFGSAF